MANQFVITAGLPNLGAEANEFYITAGLPPAISTGEPEGNPVLIIMMQHDHFNGGEEE